MSVIRRLLRLVALFFCILLSGYLYFRVILDPAVCPRKERVFLGQQYDVERCSGGGGDHHYNVRLRVYSKDNILLGQRAFSIDTDAKNNKISYEHDRIIYEHAVASEDGGMPDIETHILQFPLTRRDWFEANLDRILFAP